MTRKNLKAARIEKGMTQQQVAEYLGITLYYYKTIESGSSKGDFDLWDELEDLFHIRQRDLRMIQVDEYEVHKKYRSVRSIPGKSLNQVTKEINCDFKILEEENVILCWDGTIFKKHKDGLYRRINENPNRVYGYIQINITVNGKNKMVLAHRLIAKHFIPNPLNLPQVNHKDGNRLNNSVDNLEWCTCKENVQDAKRRHAQRYLTNLKNERLKRKLTVKQIHREINISISVYRDIENAVMRPDIEDIEKIERYFDASIDYLLAECEEKDE